jgi:ABC-type multidrug transport system fused ATPase/permease subunit
MSYFVNVLREKRTVTWQVREKNTSRYRMFPKVGTKNNLYHFTFYGSFASDHCFCLVPQLLYRYLLHLCRWQDKTKNSCGRRFKNEGYLSFINSFVRSFVLSFVRSFIHSFVLSFIHSFINSFVDSFFSSFVLSFFRSFVRSFIHSFSRSFVHSFIHYFFRSFLLSFVRSFLLSFVRSVVLSFIHSFIHSFFLSFFHSFVLSFILSFIHSFILSFVLSFVRSFVRSFARSWAGVPYDRSTASSPRRLLRVRSSARCFKFQYLLFPLKSSSSCWRLSPRDPVPFIFPSIFPSITCFRRQVLRKMRRIHWNDKIYILLEFLCPVYNI